MSVDDEVPLTVTVAVPLADTPDVRVAVTDAVAVPVRVPVPLRVPLRLGVGDALVSTTNRRRRDPSASRMLPLPGSSARVVGYSSRPPRAQSPSCSCGYERSQYHASVQLPAAGSIHPPTPGAVGLSTRRTQEEAPSDTSRSPRVSTARPVMYPNAMDVAGPTTGRGDGTAPQSPQRQGGSMICARRGAPASPLSASTTAPEARRTPAAPRSLRARRTSAWTSASKRPLSSGAPPPPVSPAAKKRDWTSALGLASPPGRSRACARRRAMGNTMGLCALSPVPATVVRVDVAVLSRRMAYSSAMYTSDGDDGPTAR